MRKTKTGSPGWLRRSETCLTLEPEWTRPRQWLWPCLCLAASRVKPGTCCWTGWMASYGYGSQMFGTNWTRHKRPSWYRIQPFDPYPDGFIHHTLLLVTARLLGKWNHWLEHPALSGTIPRTSALNPLPLVIASLLKRGCGPKRSPQHWWNHCQAATKVSVSQDFKHLSRIHPPQNGMMRCLDQSSPIFEGWFDGTTSHQPQNDIPQPSSQLHRRSMAEVEADPMFTVQGAAKDEEWKLQGPKYHPFIKRMKDAWSSSSSFSWLLCAF